MTEKTVDRTRELEERLRVLYVGSEDTCSFWQKRKNTQILIKRCFFCSHYAPNKDKETSGICTFKRSLPPEAGMKEGSL